MKLKQVTANKLKVGMVVKSLECSAYSGTVEWVETRCGTTCVIMDDSCTVVDFDAVANILQ